MSSLKKIDGYKRKVSVHDGEVFDLPEIIKNPKFPIFFRTMLLVRIFFWFLLVFISFVNFNSFENHQYLPLAYILGPFIFVALFFLISFSCIHVEKDGFTFKPFLFFPSPKIFWKNIEKVERRPILSQRNLYIFYDRTGTEPYNVNLNFFSKSDIQRFLDLVVEAAPMAQTLKAKN